MIIIPTDAEPVLSAIPDHACEPVRHVLSVIHGDIEEMGGPSYDSELDVTYHTVAANEIARICGALCAEGCVRDLHHSMEDTGLSLPDSDDRELLFELVSGTLASEGFSAIMDSEEEEPGFKVVEIEPWSGQELKDVVMRRVNAVKAPAVLDRLIQDAGPTPDGTSWTREEVIEYLDSEVLVPVKDDETWDEFARFIKGNLRFGLSLMSYFQQTHRLFGSDNPEDIRRAANIAEGETWRDGDWSKKFPGFTPGSPFEITTIDFHKIASMIDENGRVHLSNGDGRITSIFVTEDPDEYAEWRLEDGEIIEMVDGNHNALSPHPRPAIEVKPTDTED